MSDANMILGGDWEPDEWPDHVDVSHEGEADSKAYVTAHTCRMEYAGEVPPQIQYSCYFCSECGSPIYNDMEPSYCLYCGAKVADA